MTATFWGSFAAARGLAIPAAILLSPEVIMWSSLATAFGRCSEKQCCGSESGSGSFYHQAAILLPLEAIMWTSLATAFGRGLGKSDQ
jgi:hypothetical protein